MHAIQSALCWFLLPSPKRLISHQWAAQPKDRNERESPPRRHATSEMHTDAHAQCPAPIPRKTPLRGATTHLNLAHCIQGPQAPSCLRLQLG
eukprot:9858370-Alexandrium_andersonii.AAC.1